MEHPTHCPHCNVAITGHMKYCTACGKSVLDAKARDPLRASFMSFRSAAWLSAVLVLLIVIGLVAAGGNSRPSTVSSSPARMVTITARDEQGALIDPVNVWKSYTDRSQGVVGQAHDGDRVGFIQQQGGATQIELSNGARGWVNSAFIKN
jgi:hypothetical protein